MEGHLNTVEIQLLNWPKRNAIVVLLASCCLIFTGWAPLFFTIVTGHFIGLIWHSSEQWKRPGSRMVANGVTASRLVILVYIGLNWSEYDLVTLANLFWLAAILDVVDGWVAKTYGGTSTFGLILDEEVDALFVLICSYVIWQTELGPWWIMGGGWIRYLVVLVKAYLPQKPGRNSHFTWAKVLAGLVFVLFPLCLILPAGVSIYLQIITLSFLLYSFFRELIITYVYPNDLRDFPR